MSPPSPTVRPELTSVAGVPETALSPELLATLPANESTAPWTCTLAAVAWWHRGGKAATAAMPPALRGAHRGLLGVGALVRYLDTPVGAYAEALGIVGGLDGRTPFGTVAFMSVDSPASLVGGRTNWAMPKTMGAFTGEVGSGKQFAARGIDATTWSITATPRAFGPSFGVRTSALTRQQFDAQRVGTALMTGRGRARLAVVSVEVVSTGPLPSWLKPGKHLGMVISDATFTLAEPTFSNT